MYSDGDKAKQQLQDAVSEISYMVDTMQATITELEREIERLQDLLYANDIDY